MENKREERAVFVGIIRPEDDERKIMEYLDELEFLAETAGAVGDRKFVQRVDKPEKATYIRSGKEHADQVNAIVHPRVAEAFESWSRLQPSSAVFMECALLFEARFDRFVDTSILVTAPLETRISRIMNRDGASRQQALEWMALQMPEEEKEQRANYIINNDGVAEIAPQLQRIINNSYF